MHTRNMHKISISNSTRKKYMHTYINLISGELQEVHFSLECWYVLVCVSCNYVIFESLSIILVGNKYPDVEGKTSEIIFKEL